MKVGNLKFAQKGKRKLYDKMSSSLGYVNMGEFSEEDVFIVSYPKSGNTWFRNLTAGVVYGADPDLMPQSLIFDLVPPVHERSYYKRYDTPMYFKSHRLPQKAYRRVVYLLRDGRDAMVSFYHFAQARRKIDMDFLHMVQTGEGLNPCKWHDHVENWLANPFNSDMLLIKYEDLKSDPVSQLQKFCDFMNLQREASLLQLVAEKNSFAAMQKREQEKGIGLDLGKDQLFVRRGEVGSYKDEMPEDVLAAFLADAKPTLEKCGYL